MSLEAANSQHRLLFQLNSTDGHQCSGGPYFALNTEYLYLAVFVYFYLLVLEMDISALGGPLFTLNTDY